MLMFQINSKFSAVRSGVPLRMAMMPPSPKSCGSVFASETALLLPAEEVEVFLGELLDCLAVLASGKGEFIDMKLSLSMSRVSVEELNLVI